MTNKDDLLLLFLLKKRKLTYKNQKIEKNIVRFNIIINRLITDDMIMKSFENGCNKYVLSGFGELFASCLSKKASIPKKYQNNRITIRWKLFK